MRRPSLTLRLTLLFGTASTAVLVVLGYLVGIAVQGHFAEIDGDELRGKVELVRHTLAKLRTAEDFASMPGRMDDALKAITMTVAQIDKAPEPAAQDEDAEPPPPPPKSKKAAPAPAPAAEPEESAEEAPPVKRAAKPPAAVAPAKSSVADLVNQWDDE